MSAQLTIFMVTMLVCATSGFAFWLGQKTKSVAMRCVIIIVCSLANGALVSYAQRTMVSHDKLCEEICPR